VFVTRFVHFLCPCDHLPTLMPYSQVGQIVHCPQSGARMRVPLGKPFGDAEWRSCSIPEFLILYLRTLHFPFSNRKQRLLACARLLQDPRATTGGLSRRVIEAGERLADYPSDDTDRKALADALERIQRRRRFPPNPVVRQRLNLLRAVLNRDFYLYSSYLGASSPGEDNPAGCALIRDAVGDPHRPAALDPAWLTWGGGAVRKLAQVIYDERAFDRLPILADALQDAGCANADVLTHCREPAEHVRGCWVVDLLLRQS
jgi:hypothetical protein